jgi:hypothetical protein
MIVRLKSKYLPDALYELVWSQYRNGSTALSLRGLRNPAIAMTPSVNIVGVVTDKSHVLIKNWSENQGILESLIEAKVISEPLMQIPTGFVRADLCKVLL